MLGMRAYWKAFLFIIDRKLYWYALIPAFLMLGIYQSGSWIQEHRFASDTRTMNGIIWYLIKLMLEISIAMLLMQFAKYLVVTLLSPLLAWLSLKTESIVTGNTYPFTLRQFWLDIKRGLRIVVRNFMWQYFFFLVIFLICLVFWDNVNESPVFYITYLIGFYYYGFSFLDYVNERRKLTVDESILLMRKHRGLTVAIGMVYSLMILVPVDLFALFDWQRFNQAPIDVVSQFCVHFFLWFCASFAPILASVASTLAMHDLIDLRSNQYIKAPAQ